jgi:hypothetical protein
VDGSAVFDMDFRLPGMAETFLVFGYCRLGDIQNGDVSIACERRSSTSVDSPPPTSMMAEFFDANLSIRESEVSRCG